MSKPHFDLIIVGGGLVGASLACALCNTNLRIAVIEKHSFNDQSQPSFDERTIALTWASRLIFESLGVWKDIKTEAGAIKSIHISDRGHFGTTRLNTAHVGTEALGYVVPTRKIGAVLYDKLKRSANIEIICPDEVSDSKSSPSEIICETLNGRRIHGKLAILADGGRSDIGKQNNLFNDVEKYSQQALISIVESDRISEQTAYERFTEHGPLALLPMTDNRYALAWTLPSIEAARLMSSTDIEFLSELQSAFGDRVGTFIRTGLRAVYPLSLGHLEKIHQNRMLAIGNAAHIVHPVAGQGFNLGLRDVAEFVDYMESCVELSEDPGENINLEKYSAQRQKQVNRVVRFTDGLITMFTANSHGVSLARNIGLNAIDMSTQSKRFLLKKTMGIDGQLPRLIREACEA